MLPILLTIGYNFCSYAALNRNSWININVLVVLAFMLLSSLLYAFSTFIPGARREMLRGTVRYELMEGILSMLMIATLVVFASTGCQLGAALTRQTTTYTDPITFSQHYVSDLLFVKGPEINTEIYSRGITYLIDAFTINEFISSIAQKNPRPGNSPLGINIALHSGDEPAWIFFAYYGILTFFSAYIVVTFGLLFLLFLSLPLIAQLSLTIILPFSIVIRSISFSGPRLRDASNTLFSIAVALYFVLPLTLVLDSSIVNWVYCINTNPNQCNPYSQYLQSYTLSSIPVGQIFTSQESINVGGSGGASLNVPMNFLATSATASGGLFSMLNDLFLGLFEMPYIVNTVIYQIAQYLFQGIVLMALDVAITLGFAMGLAKGLNSLSTISAAGPFWSG